MRTGLDSYKLEQNNLFPNPTPTPAPHLHACSYLSCIVSGRSRERCCETESSSCLLMHTILMWADSIRQHFWLPHTPLSFTASLLLFMSLPPNVSATTRQPFVVTVDICMCYSINVLWIQDLLINDPYICIPCYSTLILLIFCFLIICFFFH